jgi:hypothetical protein
MAGYRLFFIGKWLQSSKNLLIVVARSASTLANKLINIPGYVWIVSIHQRL